METNTPAKKLYDLLVTKNYPDLEFFDFSTGKSPLKGVAYADLFTFKWTTSSGKNYGEGVIFISADKNLVFFFGDNLARGIENPADKEELFAFQLQLKQLAISNLLTWELADRSKLKQMLAGMAKMTESIFEGWNGTKTTSWTDCPDAVRLMIRHQRPLGEGDARHRYIESLFVETTDGERYKLPFKKLAGGRAMVEHVRQGGRPYDPRGQHISEMVEELNVLSRFRRANHGRIFEGEANVLVTETQAYYENLRHAMKSIASGRGYQSYFESWNPAAITEQNIMIDDIKKMFVEQSIDSRIEQALPMLVKIKQGHDMKQADIFEAWVDEITGGDQSSDSLLHTEEDQNELVELLSKELPVGAYASNTAPVMELLVNAPEDWLDKLNTKLKELAETDPDADARQEIKDRLQELANDANIISVLNRLDPDQEPTYQDPDADADEPDQEPTYQDPDADAERVNDMDEDTDSMSRIMELAGLDGDDPDMENNEMGGQGDSEDEMAGIEQDDIDAEARRNSPMGGIDEDSGSMSRIMELAGLGESDRNEISVRHVRGNEFTVTANGQQYSVTADAERDGNEYDDPGYWANVQIIDATGQPVEDPSFQDEVLTYLDTQYGDIASEEVTDTDISRADDARDAARDRDMENEGTEQLDEILPVLGALGTAARVAAPAAGAATRGAATRGAAGGYAAGSAGGASSQSTPITVPSLDHYTIDTSAKVEEGACNECGMYGMHESNCSMDEQVMLEGKFKEMLMDLEALSDAEFENKYDMTKTEAQKESSIEPDKVQEDSLIRMRQLSGILIR